MYIHTPYIDLQAGKVEDAIGAMVIPRYRNETDRSERDTSRKLAIGLIEIDPDGISPTA